MEPPGMTISRCWGMLVAIRASNDLTLRLEKFSRHIIGFCRQLQLDTISRPLVSQLVRSATSVGANYSESQNGISRNDFRAKIYICKKEAQETLYWLKVLEVAIPDRVDALLALRTETIELLKIFQAITTKLSWDLILETWYLRKHQNGCAMYWLFGMFLVYLYLSLLWSVRDNSVTGGRP